MTAIGRDAESGLPTELGLEIQGTADGNPHWHLSQPGGSGHIQLDRPIDGDVTAWTLMANGAYAGVGAGPARIDTDLGVAARPQTNRRNVPLPETGCKRSKYEAVGSTVYRRILSRLRTERTR